MYIKNGDCEPETTFCNGKLDSWDMDGTSES